MTSMEEKTKELERQITGLQLQFGVFEPSLGDKAQGIMDQVLKSFADVRIELDNVVGSARVEFTAQDAARRLLEAQATAAVAALTERVQTLERGGGRSEGGSRGYLPKKNTIPRKIDDNEEDWRQWKADVEDFLDEENPGMKQFLEEIAKQKDGITETWLNEMKGSTRLRSLTTKYKYGELSKVLRKETRER